MIGHMTTARPLQRYDHRLRELVQRTGDLTIAIDRGVPRSTARGWLRTVPTVVVGLDVANLTELELQQEVVKLRRRVQTLAALLRLALILLRVSGFTLSGERLPDVKTSCGFCGPSIRPAPVFRCAPSCGSFICRRVGSMRGDGDTPGVHSTTRRRVRACRRID